MSRDTRSPMARRFHDLNNTVGAIAMNLEVACDPKFCTGMALESVKDAVEEMKKLKTQLAALREAITEDPKEPR